LLSEFEKKAYGELPDCLVAHAGATERQARDFNNIPNEGENMSAIDDKCLALGGTGGFPGRPSMRARAAAK
jgi:hypothetical protein